VQIRRNASIKHDHLGSIIFFHALKLLRTADNVNIEINP
jgi:hypothetical protein